LGVVGDRIRLTTVRVIVRMRKAQGLSIPCQLPLLLHIPFFSGGRPGSRALTIRTGRAATTRLPRTSGSAARASPIRSSSLSCTYVQDLGCRVQGAGCRVQGVGCSVQRAACSVQRAACSVQRAACSVQRVVGGYSARFCAIDRSSPAPLPNPPPRRFTGCSGPTQPRSPAPLNPTWRALPAALSSAAPRPQTQCYRRRVHAVSRRRGQGEPTPQRQRKERIRGRG